MRDISHKILFSGNHTVVPSWWSKTWIGKLLSLTGRSTVEDVDTIKIKIKIETETETEVKKQTLSGSNHATSGKAAAAASGRRV